MIKLIIDWNSIALPHFFKWKDKDEALGYFLNEMVNKLNNTFDVKASEVLIVYDHATSRKGRQLIYKDYKAHRKSDLDEMEQKGLRQFLVEARLDMERAGAISVTHKNVEADDIILHLSHLFPDAIVWSGDKDLAQVRNIFYYRDDFYEAPDCPQGIDRFYIPLLHAIVGDPKDYGPELCKNGIGPALFNKIYDTFGDEGMEALELLIINKQLESLEEDLDEMPQLQKLIDDKDNIYLRYKLARPLRIRDYLLEWSARPNKGIKHFALRLEYEPEEFLITQDNFPEAIDELKDNIEKGHYITLDLETYHVDKSLAWLEKLNTIKDKKSKVLVDPLGSVITGIGIKCGRFAGYFSFEHKDTENLFSTDMDTLFAIVSQSKKIYCHNAIGFELPVIYNNTGCWLPNVEDTMLMASYIDENSSKGLKKLSERWLKYHQISYDEITQGKQMNELTAQHVLSYGLDDVYTTEVLARLFRTIMTAEKTIDAFDLVETEAMYSTAEAYVNGVSIDLDKLEKLKEEDYITYKKASNKVLAYLTEIGYPGVKFNPIEGLTPKEIKRAVSIVTKKPCKFNFRRYDKIKEYLKENYNLPKEMMEALENEDVENLNQFLIQYFEAEPLDVRSSKVMTELLYDHFGFPVRIRNKLTITQKQQGRTVGNPSADDDAIQHAIKYDASPEQQEFLKNILIMRECLTRKSLYYDPYPYLIHWSDGKIHSNLGQSKTTTRRFAPNNPNVNQLPKRGDGKKVREIFIASPHHVMISADFSGQELRAAAYFSEDPTLRAAFVGVNKIDLHSASGVKVDKLLDNLFNDDYNAFIKDKEKGTKETKKLRALGKGMNFSLQYFGTEMTLIRSLVVDKKLAEKMVKAYYNTYPKFIEWRENEAKLIKVKRYTRTKLGAKRHLHKYFYGGEISDYYIRSGVNFIIQSSCAEQTKYVWGKLKNLVKQYKGKLLFPVHDQVVLEVPTEVYEDFLPKFKKIMETRWWGDIPSTSDIEIGDNFGDLRGVKV